MFVTLTGMVEVSRMSILMGELKSHKMKEQKKIKPPPFFFVTDSFQSVDTMQQTEQPLSGAETVKFNEDIMTEGVDAAG